MNYSFNRIKTVTEGERLFHLLANIGHLELVRNRIAEHSYLRLSGRDAQFGEYLEGAVLCFCFKRLMKIVHGVFPDKTIDVTIGNKKVFDQLRYWFSWLKKEDLSRLSRVAISAQQASNQKIHKDIENEIFNSYHQHYCCFCGCLLDRDSKGMFRDPNGKRATLEHIWPSSLGGNSIIENLLPACTICNENKSDLFIWQQGLAHDFVYPVNFHSHESFKTIRRKDKILIQRRAVMVLAQRDRLTLKEALKKVGPYGKLNALASEETWDFFNIQNHSEFLGEILW